MVPAAFSLFAIHVNKVNKFFGRAMELSETVLCFVLPRLGSGSCASAFQGAGVLAYVTVPDFWLVFALFRCSHVSQAGLDLGTTILPESTGLIGMTHQAQIYLF